MEKKIETFTNITGSSNSKKGISASKKNVVENAKPAHIVNENFVQQQIQNNVTVTLVKDAEEDYTKLYTLQDILDLDKRKPSNIVSISPPLYHELINKATSSIKIHAPVGSVVKVQRKFMDSKGDIPREVKALHLKSLNNMTVIVATLDDGDYQLAHRLEICK